MADNRSSSVLDSLAYVANRLPRSDQEVEVDVPSLFEEAITAYCDDEDKTIEGIPRALCASKVLKPGRRKPKVIQVKSTGMEETYLPTPRYEGTDNFPYAITPEQFHTEEDIAVIPNYFKNLI
ncbi:MAG: hypothetical protein Q8Q01_04430 [archaeon]|nr:hypothetical protein [archaeon]